MSELLPLSDCPFCGSDARYQEDDSAASGGYNYWILCGECGASSDYYETPENAAEAWNLRPVQASEARGDWVMVPRDLLLTNAKRLRYRATETCGLGPETTDAGAQMVATAEALEALAAHTQAGPVG